MNNRLQFRQHNAIFETREEAVEYIYREVKYAEEGLASIDVSYGLSLFGEPTVLRYKNEEKEDDPHLMLVIGSVTNEDLGKRHSKNRFCVIDIDKTESEIKDLQEEIERIINMFRIVTKDSDTLELHSEVTETGTVISGDVKVAEYHVFDRVAKDNAIMVTENGLFTFIGLDYDDNTGTFTFTVNGETTTFVVNGNQITGGSYNPEDESLHITTKYGDDIAIDLEYLIDEWVVEGEATKSPIVLTRKEVGYDDEPEHHHVEPWQDILSADVRIADERVNNILKKTTDNRYLYVDGVATNIVYYSSSGKSDVQSALDELSKVRVSTDSNNIVTTKADGFFASTKLEYISNENTLVFTTSTNDEDEKKKETRIKLNSFSVFENIVYDPIKETLIITYIDGNGDTKFLTIPIGELLTNWEIDVISEGHNVFMQKTRNIQGTDLISSDVKIFNGSDNILEDLNHMLYVKGTSDNIKHGDNSTVKAELDALKSVDAALDNKINLEIVRAQSKESELNSFIEAEATRAINEETTLSATIGSGFTTDSHETVTYKFEQLQNQVNEEADKLQDEIDRSTAKDDEHDGKIQAIEDEIGDGFGPRNTVRDEIDNLQAEIEAVSADSASSLKDIINIDKSINVDKTSPTKPVISVNLSTEVEDERYNIIKLNADGLFANVDLSYEETANKLIFHTSNGQPDKEIQLESMSSIISIEYNPTKEAIVITYMTNGHEIKTVEIPVGDLINEWRVEDGHPNAVQLEKVRVASGTSEQDVLKASVVISDTHDDNILINDNGALYVSGKGISDNAAAIEREIERAIAAENSLNGAINNEIDRATNAESVLDEKITSEKNRAIDKENEIEDSIHNEVVRALSAETALKAASDLIASNVDALTSGMESEIVRLDDKDAELEEKIDTIDDEYLINFDNTNTVSFSKNAASKGYIVKANVAIDAANDNNIKETANGIYSTVDLTYDNTSNKLTFVTTNGSKEIALVSNSIVNKIYYNSSNETIVIEYTVNGQRMDDVIVPVRDLINEIDVASTSSVELIKTPNTSTGADIISANVKLNEYHTDNILVDDGGLYVSGAQIAINKDNITDLDERLESEIARATNEENTLRTSVLNNAAAISTEIIRATSAETILSNAITAEETRAINKENALESKINNGIASATSSLENAIVIEKNRAENAESVLNDKINEVSGKTFSLSVEDTTTIDLTLDENNKLSGNVVLANGDSNILKSSSNTADGSGLYATVDLEYNPATNKLKLITSAGEKEFSLSVGSIIKSIEYDSIGKNLIIKYDVNIGGVIHEEEVFVPVEDLFNDWTVQEGQHLGAIILHKEEGTSGNPDVLSAEVVISTLSDNILMNDQGSLYVSRRPIDDVSGQVQTLREEFEISLETEDTKTLHLERTAASRLKGEVKISENENNLIKVDRANDGIMFDGNIDCGTY